MSRFYTLMLLFFLLGLVVNPSMVNAQSISGQVYNSQQEAIPFANIYIQQLQSGTATDEKGHFFLNLNPGEYNLVVSSIGYVSTTHTVVVGDKELVMDFQMQASNIELEEVIVRASKKDPAYEIIQKVIDNKKKYLTQIQQSRCEVYVKATEVLNEKDKKEDVSKKERAPLIQLEGNAEPEDPFDAAEIAKKELADKLNMMEMQVILNFQQPARYKEERIAYKAYGEKAGLFVPQFGEADFNFYRNLVDLKGIAEVPLISPISRTAILSYKYKLESSEEENGQLVHKIKVIPRKTGNATCKGYLYINDGLWNINRLDLDLYEGALKFYDDFNLQQNYQQIDDSLWIVNRQEFNYQTKQGRFKTFEGQTLLRYSNFQNNYPFPPRFFGNEIAITTAEAYQRDSSYWLQVRPEPLSSDQQKMVTYRDSIDAVHNSPAYLDSVEQAYNQVTLLEILWDGVGFRNNAKKQNIYIGSLATLLGFEVVGGFRLGPYMSYYRKYENGRRLNTYGTLDIGLKNLDPQGNIYTWFRYNPHRLADVSLWGGREFESINNYDAFLNQLRSSNYILNDHLGMRHRIELFNGFYLELEAAYNDRKSIKAFDSKTFLDDLIKDEEPLVFEPYQALVSEWSISYTPGQRFVTEPTEKIILGSAFPTFTFGHKKGWNKLLASDVDFDYLHFDMEQDLTLGYWGNMKYTLKTGKFFNTRNLPFVDLKRFRQSDPILYSNPLHSFQSLDTALVATDWFFEAHVIHHFNGLLINNIPLVKKLRIQAVAGAGILWIKESQFRHEEIFAGLERVFKLGPRRRLRVGAYGVLAQSNDQAVKPNFKISLDLIDTWKKDWSF